MRKLTHNDLRQLITNTCRHNLHEAYVETPDIHDIDPTDLIAFANGCINMGNIVFEQFEHLLSEGPGAEINQNALEVMKDAVGGMNAMIDDALEEASAVDDEDY